MDLYEVMRTTSAVREFTGDPLPDDVLRTILDNARFAPSGGNRQGTQILVVRDLDTRRALAELTVPGARRYTAQKRGRRGAVEPGRPTRLSEEEIAATDVPRLLDVACPRGRGGARRLRRPPSWWRPLDQDLDRVGIVGGASVYPLVWNILLAARHEGFGGTITTMAVAEEPRVAGAVRHPGGVRRRVRRTDGQAGPPADQAVAGLVSRT